MINTNTFHTERFIEELQTRGSYPSKIECSDGNIYIVKHSQLGINYKQLINEYIAAHLAKAIGLSVPDFALIKINPEIFPDNVNLKGVNLMAWVLDLNFWMVFLMNFLRGQNTAN